jgi:hypothetical protein
VPKLFPEAVNGGVGTIQAVPSKAAVSFGSSPKFDFTNGDFITTPSGKIAECTDTEAWLEWCKKALHTSRYTHLVYSSMYGQEYENLIAQGLSRAANEMEIVRITTETLKVDPRTADVGRFTFEWDQGVCSFQCEITNVRGKKEILKESVVTG